MPRRVPSWVILIALLGSVSVAVFTAMPWQLWWDACSLAMAIWLSLRIVERWRDRGHSPELAPIRDNGSQRKGTNMGSMASTPPRNEVFDVTFHPLMRDRLLDWLAENGWSLVCVPGSYAKIPSFIVMESQTPPLDPSSSVCAICGTPLVHARCPICAAPHGFLGYEAGSPHTWCKVCGLDESDVRAHHESGTA